MDKTWVDTRYGLKVEASCRTEATIKLNKILFQVIQVLKKHPETRGISIIPVGMGDSEVVVCECKCEFECKHQ